jgi:hypothetical protein
MKIFHSHQLILNSLIFFGKALAITLSLNVSVGSVSASPMGNFPRIALMYATHYPNRNLTLDEVSRYDLILDNGLLAALSDSDLATVRQANPGFVGLMATAVIYINSDVPLLFQPDFNESYLIHYAPSIGFNVPSCDPSLRVIFPNWDPPIYFYNMSL